MQNPSKIGKGICSLYRKETERYEFDAPNAKNRRLLGFKLLFIIYF